jgi:hypothetical protein
LISRALLERERSHSYMSGLFKGVQFQSSCMITSVPEAPSLLNVHAAGAEQMGREARSNL